MGIYFGSKIYNNKYFSLDEPTFSVLSSQNNFGIDEAVNYANSIKLKTIFIICSGQQTLGDQYINDYGDLLYGEQLTGCNRLGNNNEDENKYFWNGKFKIYNSSNPKYKNTASILYDTYINDSLVIDILNTRYDWQLDPFYFADIINFLKNVIYDSIYCKLNDKNRESVKLFICGFSRGGIVSLRLVEKFKEIFGNDLINKIDKVVTIDPVVNPMTEFDIIDYFAVKQKGKWLRKEKNKYLPDYFSPNIIPVLKSIEGIKYYNVFQRRAWTEQPNAVQKPIGSAVNKANYYSDINKDIPANDDVRNSVMQYDMSINAHTPDMLNKYADWIINIKNNC